jgi:hypothetical protein
VVKQICLVLSLILCVVACNKGDRSSSPDASKEQQTTEEKQLDTSKFKNTYSAAKKIEGVITVGVNNPKFRDVVQEFATEMAILKDSIKTNTEKELYSYYDEALKIYMDSLTFWDWSLKNSPNLYGQGTFLVNKEKIDFLSKYHISFREVTDKPQSLSDVDLYIVDKNSIQQIWSAADTQLKTAYGLQGL